MKKLHKIGPVLALTLMFSMTAADGFAQDDEDDGSLTVTEPTRARGTTADPTEADLRAVLAELQNEPSIREVQRAALDFYKLSSSKIEGMKGRAATKALVPKVSAEARFNAIDIDVNRFDFVNFPDRQAGEDVISGSVNEYKGVVTWDLPKLIYNPEVLDVYSLKRYREQVMKEVTRLFYLRRRIQIDFMLNPPADPQTYIVKKLRIDEVTAMLDAMTGGIYASSEDR